MESEQVLAILNENTMININIKRDYYKMTDIIVAKDAKKEEKKTKKKSTRLESNGQDIFRDHS